MRVGVGYQFLFIFALGCVLNACASGKTERASCDQRDWFELGRNDGSRGSTNDQLNKYREDCGGAKSRPDWDRMYANGRNAGLVEYCSSANALELGKSGIPYMFVCPPTMESEFLAGYRKGQRARELELESHKLETEIDTLNQKLAITSGEEKVALQEELGKLTAKKSETEQELNKTISKRQ
jgi:hypothetical protein